MSVPCPLGLRHRIGEILRQRGLTVNWLIHHLGRRNRATGWRLMTGRTVDPRLVTVLDVCRTLSVDPDELLEVSRPPLDPEVDELFAAAQALQEQDQWLLVDLIKSMRRHE